MKKLLLGFAVVFGMSSCEDVISVDVEDGTIQLAVDAFINSKKETQKIVLKKTKQFFDDVSQEPFNADSVYVVDDLNNKYIFDDINGDGSYTWFVSDSSIVKANRSYSLTIKAGDLLYTASTMANPVPQIDSLNWEYVEPQLGQDNGGYAVELVARDLVGQTDYYWIKFKKNGKYDISKSNINISVDGSFSAESNNDGQLFIAPISTLSAYNVDDSLGIGDQATYEIWGITKETFGFWGQVSNQVIAGGIGALFATPTANVKTNIVSSSNVISEQAVGWFSASVVSEASVTIFDKPGEKVSFDINQ